jgi:predicted AAA+ superfamily ATPase
MSAIMGGGQLALFAGFAIYLAQIVLCGGSQTREQLVEAPYRTLMEHALFGAGFASRQSARLGPELAARIVAGGYPAALTRTSTQRRTRWYRNYLEAMVQRDVRDLARIAALDALPRLLEVAAGQTARLVNVLSAVVLQPIFR